MYTAISLHLINLFYVIPCFRWDAIYLFCTPKLSSVYLLVRMKLCMKLTIKCRVKCEIKWHHDQSICMNFANSIWVSAYLCILPCNLPCIAYFFKDTFSFRTINCPCVVENVLLVCWTTATVYIQGLY
jgi:hypothetical protein